MRYRYYICDVFTDRPFAGNQLAVLPEAEGLSDEQMQQIAREFNFSETTFVLPPESGHTRRVRIFTPATEVPFAGHPNIGTAYVLAVTGALGDIGDTSTVTFEEQAGLVEIAIRREAPGRWTCELTAPQAVSLGPTVPAEVVAPIISLHPDDILTDPHPPQVASVGLPFLMVRVKDRDALARARVVIDRLTALTERGVTPDVHLYTLSNDDFDLRARMFAPLDGVPEDPATGSANCALAALLAHVDKSPDGVFSWRIAQGVEMGRPSVLEATAVKAGGRVAAARIGGPSVLVAEGTIEVS